MDPFTGLGSTAVACARLGVEFIGADVDETYLREAVSRTKEAAARRALKVDRVKARTAKASSS